MKITEISKREPHLLQSLTALWERSVIATHLFLSAEEIAQIKQYLPQALSEVAHLIIAPNEHGEPLGFMGINEQKLKVLFLDCFARAGLRQKTITIRDRQIRRQRAKSAGGRILQALKF